MSGRMRFPGHYGSALVLGAASLLAPFLTAQSTTSAGVVDAGEGYRGQELAVFEGHPLYEQDLAAADQVQLEKMMQQVYSVQLRAIRAATEHRLIAAEAKRRGLSVEELFKIEVAGKVNEASEAQAREYYEAHKQQIGKPFESVDETIRQALKQTAVQKAQATYVQELTQKAMNDGTLELLVKPPKVEVSGDPARTRGNEQAVVTIVEFSDYSCPFCRAAERTMNELLAKYPGKVKLSYRDFPLRELHPEAEKAAEASRCAGEQGHYWEFHDLLFASKGKHDREELMGDARTIGLDEGAFGMCLTTERYRQQVDQDVMLGSRAGVVSTPGFFINGQFVSGAQPATTFESVIDRALARASNPDLAQTKVVR